MAGTSGGGKGAPALFAWLAWLLLACAWVIMLGGVGALQQVRGTVARYRLPMLLLPRHLLLVLACSAGSYSSTPAALPPLQNCGDSSANSLNAAGPVDCESQPGEGKLGRAEPGAGCSWWEGQV